MELGGVPLGEDLERLAVHHDSGALGANLLSQVR